jgi:hypothetical protein
MSRHHRTWATAWSVGRLLSQRWPLPKALAQRPELMEPGQRLHEWTYLHDTGGLCPAPDDTIAGWADAWKQFSYTFTPSWDFREHVFEVLPSDTLPVGFHGIVDAAGSVRGRMTVADLKTGKPDDQHQVQLALYAMGMFPKTAMKIQRLNIYLTKDGRFRVMVRDDPRDLLLARELLTQAGQEGA